MNHVRRRLVEFLFQSFKLLSALSAQENVEVVMNMAGIPSKQATARAQDLLASMGLSGRAKHKPAELSGGEKQRVALARALANEPALILAEEPTANLDSQRGREVMTLLRTIAKEQGRTVVIVGHDARIREVADHVLWMIDRVIAEVLPVEKERVIRRLQQQGEIVGMVGDGVNDAPALAAADIGIAIGSGSDVAKETGRIILIKDDIRDVVTSIRLSRATMRKIKQTLFWALAYNSAAIPIAAVGLLNPIIAAAAMALSSLSVIVNSALLKGARLSDAGVVRTVEEPERKEGKVTLTKDPVCGMEVDQKKAAGQYRHDGKTCSFCSTKCHLRFKENPKAYVNGGSRGS
ncbi:MAG: ATP-binding cassette domain-containing protein [Dehalococcoidia bacterium]|nr:ATP-binding cassette domain-containing protein [Dehalococcoidia bacterium]